jgi:DNA-binding beta-propeller fold protein YncE
MKALCLACCAASLCTAMLLPGCVPTQSVEAPDVAPQDTPFPPAPTGVRPTGWISPEARTKARIYVADQSFSKVLIYSELDGILLGEITDGVAGPYGLYVDRHGTLYVANASKNTVTAYPDGSESPSITWSADLHGPLYPIVDGNGDLFVSNDNGTVVEYLSGSTSANQVLQTPGREADGLDFDSQGNLYVAFRKSDSKRAAGIEEFAPGSTQGTILPMKLIAPQGLIVDKRDNILVVETETKNRIALFPPGHKYKSRAISGPESSYRGASLTQLAIKANETELFVSDLNGGVYTIAYPFPQSGTLNELLQTPGSATIQGVALSNGQTF